MGKVKLRKLDKPGNKSKTFNLQDKDGNERILKATIVSVSPYELKKQESNILPEINFERVGILRDIVAPPLSNAELSVLHEKSSELGQIIEAMEVGISGFGGRLIEVEMTDEQKKTHEKQIKEEKSFLKTFFDYTNVKDDFTSFKRKSRQYMESTGNAYWELVPGVKGGTRYSAMNLIAPQSTFITKMDKKASKVSFNYLKADFTFGKKSFLNRFRRFVQIVGNKKVYFKEFGDRRIIDKRTGEEAKESIDKKYYANEVIHRKIPTPRRTPYGMPRFTGNIITIQGSRSTDETNILTLMNNNIPSVAILVNGGMLTSGSIKRIQDFVDTQIKGSSNYSKFLILEGEATHDGLSNASQSKIEIQPLTKGQHSDMLWQDYDKNNASKIRRSFRMAPILVGSSENYDRGTAQTSEVLTEKYVYNPEREAEDRIISKLLLQMGIKFWTYKSNSPNVTNDADLVKILTGAEKTGGLTPRISRMLLADILNRELPPIEENIPENLKEFFHPDVPFSLSLALLMHSAGKANQNGTFESQGQTPKAPGNSRSDQDPNKKTDQKLDPMVVLDEFLNQPYEAIDKLTEVRNSIESILDEAGFGEDREDYFDNDDSEEEDEDHLDEDDSGEEDHLDV